MLLASSATIAIFFLFHFFPRFIFKTFLRIDFLGLIEPGQLSLLKFVKQIYEFYSKS